MDKEELKASIDFNRISELVGVDRFTNDEYKIDYLMDDKGNYIIRLSPLDYKLIEKIKDLEERIKKLEGV